MGGPSLEEEAWSSIRLAIYRLVADIYRLDIVRDGSKITLTGEVTRDDVKATIEESMRRHGVDVDNQLVVAAPFKPAGDIEFSARTTALSGPTPTNSICRFPDVRKVSEAIPDEEFVFTVDLTVGDPGDGASISIDGVPPDWSSLEVEAEVVSNALVFEEGESVKPVGIKADESSVAAEFRALLRPMPGAVSFEIRILFSFKGRHSGMTRKTFDVEAKPGPIGEPVAVAKPAAVVISPSARPPTLTIRISDIGGGRYHWSSIAPQGVGKGPRDGTIELEDAREFARDLIGRCPHMAPGKHRSQLRGIGERIWRTTPERFRGLMAAMRQKYGSEFPIQIITDETFVPWEMMFPTDDSGIADPTHLFLTHPMARWFNAHDAVVRDSLPKGAVACFVPEYEDGSALPSTLREAAWFERELGAVRPEASCDSFNGYLGPEMPPTTTAIVHFAGHGRAKDGSAASAILMTDDWVTSDEIHGGVKLGERDGSYVILNACAVGAEQAQLGVLDGFPSSLASRGFRAVLAPIWSVLDSQASQIVCDQAKYLMDGKSLGVSVRDARATHYNASSTPYAYICYGDVMARIA
ncbi:CHAT domain-containing protein [Bosea massiliensis]|uniref:CHAT domain-containing protein n=1 Tax=Bosea massiliensis TaxID=151419 RepID=A0ABW0P836_9HYPH